MKTELSDAEVAVMIELWANPGRPAKELSFLLYQKQDWAPGTSYTLLGRCEKKGAAHRDEKGRWYPSVEKEAIRQQKLRNLLNNLFDGSAATFLCHFTEYVADSDLTPETLAKLNELAEKLKAAE